MWNHVQTAIMIRSILVFAVVIIEYVYGRPPLPPLPMKAGCYLVAPEVNLSRLEGEAVILSFPMFQRVLKVRNIAPPTAKFVITKDNGTEGVAYHGEGRVQQSDKELWLLPANASDSGKYICTYSNETYCVTGSIKLHVYKSSSVDMKKLSHPVSAMVGENLAIKCPSISDFNKTGRLIEWVKDSSPTPLQSGRDRSRDNGRLMIPAVKQSHSGVYTCQLTVLINNQQYKVSRAIQLHVQAPVIQPPVIVSPLNGTIFESLHGSGLELFCKVLTDCQMADSTVVTWLVNGQSVESSYLDGRALQGGRRATRVSSGCQIELRLIFMEIFDEDTQTELKCVTQNQGGRQEVVVQLQLEDSTFTWLVVAVVAVSCFLAVVSVFLYVLFKPKRKQKMDYFLARQNSTF
uniref:interleukin-1 receptor type 2 isoform X3 n=1 Tax=Scatophagus argus TaxID=75038 RepID=UPI001ED86352|nr:interleukin-1 receptor type 2 isoform X3 [Scatophagus argus]